MKEMDEKMRVCLLFSQWAAAIKLSNSGGYTDINRVSENLALRLLNALFDYELENLNRTKGNYPGIDLGCQKTKIAFQVTSEDRLQKIKETVKTFFGSPDSKLYSLGVRIFLLSDRKRTIKKQQQQEAFWKKYPGFDPQNHIMAFPDLMTEIERCYSEDRPRFANIKQLLEDELGFGEHASGQRQLLEQLFEGSIRYRDDLRGTGGRFRHLNISEIIISPTEQKKSRLFIDAPVRLDEGRDEAHDIHSANVLTAIPRIWNQDCWHAMLVGEGGMGKTVSLVRLWENLLGDGAFNSMVPVPIFIPLNEFNETISDHERRNFIKNMIRKHYLERGDRSFELRDILSRPPRENSGSSPSVILLLDGFNEVTIEKRQLLIELREMIEHWKGAQIIISSRLDTRFTMNWYDFHLITLLGLDDTSIQNYLACKSIDLPKPGSEARDRRLLDLMKNPMMLTLYASTCEIQLSQVSSPQFDFRPNAASPGELLWNFIEAQVAKYHTRQGIPDSTKHRHRFLLKHILPAIGHHMETEGRFEFDLKSLSSSIDSYLANLSADEFFDTFPEYIEHEDHLPLRKAGDLDHRKQTSGLIRTLSDELFMLVKEGTSYRFLHQNFRDFFAAVHILNLANISLANNKLPHLLKDTVIPFYPRQYIGEIEGEHHNKPVSEPGFGWKPKDSSRTVLAQSLELCRNIFDGSTKLAVWNILEIWKQVRGEWTGLDLSRLDLSKITINSVKCSRPFHEDYLAANFAHSLVHAYNIFPQGHTWLVNSAIYSTDGKNILSTSRDRTIKEWDAETGECRRTLTGHTNTVNNAIYSNDGKKILSVSRDHTIKEWDRVNGGCTRTLTGHTGWVTSASYSPDRKKILSSSADKTVKEWDTVTGNCLRTFHGHAEWVTGAAYSPDGQRILSASEDHTIKLWDTATGECILTLDAHDGWVNRAAYSPDGKTILSASADATVKEWDAETGECRRTFVGHTNRVTSATYSADSKKILTASWDKTVKEWDSSTGECLKTLRGHQKTITSAIYSPDGTRILSASWDNTIKEWDAETGECTKTINGYDDRVTSVEYSGDCKKIRSHSRDRTIKDWCSENGRCLNTWLEGEEPDTPANHHPYLEKDNPALEGKNNGFEYLDKITGRKRTIVNIPGLWIQGCPFEKLHPESDLSEEEIDLLRMYGARNI